MSIGAIKAKVLRTGLALALCAGLAACSSAFRNAPLIGEPADVPPPPANPTAAPAFRDEANAPRRSMTAAERAKAEAELAAERTRAAEEKRKQIQR